MRLHVQRNADSFCFALAGIWRIPFGPGHFFQRLSAGPEKTSLVGLNRDQ